MKATTLRTWSKRSKILISDRIAAMVAGPMPGMVRQKLSIIGFRERLERP